MSPALFSCVDTGDQVAAISCNLEQVSGVGGAWYPRLMVPCRLEFYKIRKPAADFLFTSLDAELVHERGGKVADAQTAKLQRVMRTHWLHNGEENVTLEFPLDVRRIQRLEELRKGKDISFHLNVNMGVESHGIIEGDTKLKRTPLWGFNWPLRLNAQIIITIPRSVWIERVLPQIGYGVIHVFEVPAVPLEKYESFKNCYDALRQAQELHLQGLYDDAVGKCRLAMDPFFEQIPVDPTHPDSRKIPILKKSWATRIGEGTYQWLNGTLTALKGPTNIPHHLPVANYSQLESQMIQMITVAIVSYASRLLSDESK